MRLARLLYGDLIGDRAGTYHIAFDDHFSLAQEIGIDHVAGDDRNDDLVIADDAASGSLGEG